MKIYNNVLETIGNTPLVRLKKIEELYNLDANLIGKIEAVNPGGSIKDRIAKEMIFDAMKKGIINKDSLLIEATSGNTGIGLAMVASVLGLKLVIVMPSNMSIERIKLIKSYGANVLLTDASLGMTGAINKANELLKENPNSFMPSQFDNINNWKAHYLTTGKEIYEDLDGKVDIVISGVGTGGTISGIGKFLKEKNPNVRLIAVEPSTSAVLSGKEKGPHKIQGIGAGFIPSILDTNIYDEVMAISDSEAMEKARIISKIEGISVGISSGAALACGIEVAKRSENKGKNIVIIFPDSGIKYLSTELYEE